MTKLLRRSRLPLCAAFFLSISGNAQTVVSEANVVRQAENTPPTNNWVLYTRPGTPPSAGVFVNGPGTPPLGCGSLQLTTADGSQKVFLFNYDHVGTKLSDINAIAYSTYRTAGNNQQVASLNLQVDINGGTLDPGDFTTLVFEPVYNTSQGAVVNNTWQNWNAIDGGNAIWWSTRSIPGVCAFTCYVTWNQILAANPNATIVGGIGINQGSGNPSLVDAVDAFTFNATTYNFEPSADADGDGQGDACDNDDDGDGVNDDIDCDPLDKKNDKVLICHKGQTLCVAQNAVSAHVRHGDAVGPCAVSSSRSLPSENNVTQIGKFSLVSSPNPARGVARIQYTIPADSRVNIKIYDLMGREVTTLFNGSREPGTYNVEYNTSLLNSGLYYCRMITINDGKENMQTMKLVKAE